MAGGTCMAGGMCYRGHAGMVGACMAGGMHGRDMHGRWACMSGGMHGRGMHGRGHAWQGACMAGETATAADGMHPTGMHSCLVMNLPLMIITQKCNISRLPHRDLEYRELPTTLYQLSS